MGRDDTYGFVPPPVPMLGADDGDQIGVLDDDPKREWPSRDFRDVARTVLVWATWLLIAFALFVVLMLVLRKLFPGVICVKPKPWDPSD